MADYSYKNILSGTVWGILAKIIDALAKFVTIPLLVGFYGKADYGLIALAFSLNTYLRLMDMGMNIGSIRFFSIWIAEKNWDKISIVSRSSMVFYGSIGLINALVFVYMAHYAGNFFKLTTDQLPVFKWIMYVLAASTILNWMSNVISQLLTAYGEIAWVNRVAVISSIFNFVIAFLAVEFTLSLTLYFFLYILSTLMVIPLNIFRLKVYKMPIWKLINPKWHGKAFKEILTYSLALFAMGIFQFSADNLRPLLLGKFASKGIEVLTEYRVIQTLSMLIVAFGGVFMQVLLPSVSKAYKENNKRNINDLIFNGTKLVSLFLSFIVFLLIVNAEPLLNLYMGSEYGNLSIWLSVWLITVLIAMHNTPVASLVMASGKTKPLLISSATSCLVSLPITALFAEQLNVGAAVLGYFVYVLMQIVFYYTYYIPKVLRVNSMRLLSKSFIPSLGAGVISCGGSLLLNSILELKFYWHILFSRSIVFCTIYLIIILIFVIKMKDYKNLRKVSVT